MIYSNESHALFIMHELVSSLYLCVEKLTEVCKKNNRTLAVVLYMFIMIVAFNIISVTSQVMIHFVFITTHVCIEPPITKVAR